LCLKCTCSDYNEKYVDILMPIFATLQFEINKKKSILAIVHKTAIITA
jgi:hypothetical protein